ncbi:MAG TPA: nicotinate-nucleotide adenylyltransferase [Candidatus Limnocylindrales bacterium]|nr:nicotinate-nucleotide adenylyltransferase [Candidatus Limnocylindrales bacterium]
MQGLRTVSTSGSPPPVRPGSLGVLGGTFDPIHLGHLVIAEQVRVALGLERVLFVPAGTPPHKPGRPISRAGDRLAMVELAIADHPAFEASRLEVDRPGPSYSVDTLASLAEAARAAGREPDLTFILSAEAFEEIETWHEPSRILQLATIAVVPRGAARPPSRSWVGERFPGLEDRVVLVDAPRIELSASGIRDRVRRGWSIRYLVPPPVEAYIADHRLYRTASLEEEPS